MRGTRSRVLLFIVIHENKAIAEHRKAGLQKKLSSGKLKKITVL